LVQIELLDGYLRVEDADALYAEYATKGVEFTRGLANMPWRSGEFVAKDCDGRLLPFAANLYLPSFVRIHKRYGSDRSNLYTCPWRPDEGKRDLNCRRQGITLIDIQ